MNEERTTSTMQDERSSEVLGSLPRSRPHRRSDKRATTRPARAAAPSAPEATASTGTKTAAKAKPAASRATKASTRTSKTSAASTPRAATPRAHRTAKTLRQPPQPGGVPPQPEASDTGARDRSPDILRTAVQATAELAEMGLSASARALRQAVSRLPRP